MDRTLFLWLVSTALVFPAARSHSLIVESWLPVTTCNKFNVVYNQKEGAPVRHTYSLIGVSKVVVSDIKSFIGEHAPPRPPDLIIRQKKNRTQITARGGS